MKPDWPAAFYTAAQVRELDRRAIEDEGIDGYALMQRAAAAGFRLLRLRWPGARRIAVFCGGGNNGGDGVVLARLAREAGLEPALALHGDPARLSGAAASAWADWNSPAEPGPTGGLDAFDPDAFDLVVDAMLGTGLDRPVRGPIGEAIARINASATPVLALDIPSGLDADSGAVLGDAVVADATATFIGAKRGLYTGAGPDRAGPVFLDRLAVPERVFRGFDATLGAPVRRVDAQGAARVLPARRPGAHKGDSGHLLIVGGDHGFAGAPRMAAEAALRCGAGLVSVATRADHAAAMAAARPELMVKAVEDPASDLPPLLARADAVAIGPGLGRGEWGAAALRAVLGQGPLRRVIDADGLNLLAGGPPLDLGGAVLTPHPGEAARMLGDTTEAIQADRFGTARALAERWNASVLLKGAGTVVTDPRGQAALLPGGRPAMAVGGMGDVLTGIVGALVGQGVAPLDAASAGAWLHAEAADRAIGQGTVLPGDLFPLLGHLRQSALHG